MKGLPAGRLRVIDALRRIARERAVVSVIDQGIVSATGIATTLLVGRWGGATELGIFAMGLALILLVDEQLASLTSTPYMILAPSRRGVSRDRLAGSHFVHLLVLSVPVVSVLLLAAVLARLLGWGDAARVAVTSAVLALPLYVAAQAIRRFLFVELRFSTALQCDLAGGLIQMACLGGLAVTGRLTGPTALLIVSLSKFVGLAPALFLTGIRWRPGIRFTKCHARRAWLLGRWVLLASLFWSVAAQLYPWFLTASHGVASAGVWAACLSVGNVMSPILLGGQNFAGPRLVEVFRTQSDQVALRHTMRTSVAFVLVLAPIATALSIWGGDAVVALYGSEYAGQGLVVTLIAWSTVIAGAGFPLSRALFGRERTGLDLVGSAASAAVVCTFGLLFVRLWGPLGAAWSSLGANSTGAVTRLGLLRLGGGLPAHRRSLRQERP